MLNNFDAIVYTNYTNLASGEETEIGISLDNLNDLSASVADNNQLLQITIWDRAIQIAKDAGEIPGGTPRNIARGLVGDLAQQLIADTYVENNEGNNGRSRPNNN